LLAGPAQHLYRTPAGQTAQCGAGRQLSSPPAVPPA